MTTHRGIDLAQAAMSSLGNHSGDISSAVTRIEHLKKHTKDELIEALAFTACQVGAYRRIANEDAALAISQVRSIVASYDARRPGPYVEEVSA